MERLAAPPPLDGFSVDPESGLIFNDKGVEVGRRNDRGYVIVSCRGHRGRKSLRAHRVVWEAVHGQIPAGLEINHINGEKADNRLENLELVTRGQNHAHAYRIGLRSSRGERHPQARLTFSQVQEIRRRATGETQRSLAREFGVSAPHINRIVKGRCWNGEEAA